MNIKILLDFGKNVLRVNESYYRSIVRFIVELNNLFLCLFGFIDIWIDVYK